MLWFIKKSFQHHLLCSHSTCLFLVQDIFLIQTNLSENSNLFYHMSWDFSCLMFILHVKMNLDLFFHSMLACLGLLSVIVATLTPRQDHVSFYSLVQCTLQALSSTLRDDVCHGCPYISRFKPWKQQHKRYYQIICKLKEHCSAKTEYPYRISLPSLIYFDFLSFLSLFLSHDTVPYSLRKLIYSREWIESLFFTVFFGCNFPWKSLNGSRVTRLIFKWEMKAVLN